MYISTVVTGRRSAAFHLPRQLDAPVVTVHYEVTPPKESPVTIPPRLTLSSSDLCAHYLPTMTDALMKANPKKIAAKGKELDG